jgi:hypothetical protein
MTWSDLRARPSWLLVICGIAAGTAGCKEKQQRLDSARAAERAASTRLAELQAQQTAYRKERVELEQRISAADEKLREARHALNRTMAAANHFVDDLDLPGADASALLAADPLFRLKEAVEKRDLDAVSKAASAVATASAPCVSSKAPASEECDNTGYTNACDEVAKREVHAPTWQCSRVAPQGGAPALAFCTAEIDYRGPIETGKAWDTGGPELPTKHQIVRTAFVHASQIHVADWPAPTLDGYYPPDVTVLERCRAETARRSCVHDCDVKYGRWSDPCSEAEDQEGDSCCGDSCCGNDEGDGYGDCVRECEGGDEGDEASDESNDDKSRVSKEPTGIERTIRLVESPAAGVFVVEEDFITLAGTRTHSVETKTHLLVNRAVLDVALHKKVSKDSEGRGNFGQMETVATLGDSRATALAKKMKALEGATPSPARFLGKLDGARVLAGIAEDGVPHGYVMSAIRDVGDLGKLELPNLCDKVHEHPQHFGAAAQDLAAGCDKVAKAEAKLASLKQVVESIKSASDLIKFRKDLPDHRKTLFQKQQTELFKAFYEKQKLVTKAVFEDFNERAQSTNDLAGIENLHKELMDIIGVFEMAGDLRKTLEDSVGAKRTALRKKELEAIKQRIAAARDSKELEDIKFEIQDLQLRTEFERARRTRMEALKRRPDAGRDMGGAR